MKNLAKVAFAAIGALLWCTTTNAQTINIGPNQYAFQYTLDPDFGLFFNATDGRYEFRNGSASPVIGFNANNGEFTTNLALGPGSDLLIGNNRYAFRASSNPNYGLFFNGTSTEYQFLSSSAAPVFAVHANNGNMRVTGGLRVGNSFAAQAGNIRWTGSDFQGYNGSSWASLTTGPAGPVGPQGPAGPQGPQGIQGPAGLLPAGTTNAVPRYTGTGWDVTNTGMTNNGTSVGIGGIPSDERLYATALTSDAVAGGSVIEAFRNGLVSAPGALTSWSLGDAAIRGSQNWGNNYTAAVLGTTVLDFENSAAVVGSGGGVFGGLAYRSANGNKAGYFNGDVEMTAALDVAEKITVAGSSLTDSVGINLDAQNLWYQSDAWYFGETNSGGGAISGDYIMGRFGQKEYIFWTSYFRPVQDNQHQLGGFSNRWSTIYASNGTINTSDAREKKNIKELDYGLETLMQLKPVSYEWNDDVDNVGTKLGFVAQDLLEVVPEVVVTEEKVENRETGEITYQEAERMGVFYDDLIPVLTKAIQEQQGTIEELTEENEILQDQLKDVLDRMDLFEQDLQSCCFSSQGGSEVGTNNNSSDDAELGQNIPNPFSESTIIRYYLPDGTTNAIIRVTDMGGSPVQDLQLGAVRGANQVEFQTQGLAAGTYLYSLFVDGKFVDTKKMMIAR
ncbi:MAG TPA: tail fiber domain-containing protein [Cryomorphaceae bacterium]|nr:tail fiber domain-containing protein [Cryomorphaceae bacterium]